ncbi:hypothetical protein [Paraliobacillus sp. JSM ZJ581]
MLLSLYFLSVILITFKVISFIDKLTTRNRKKTFMDADPTQPVLAFPEN